MTDETLKIHMRHADVVKGDRYIWYINDKREAALWHDPTIEKTWCVAVYSRISGNKIGAIHFFESQSDASDLIKKLIPEEPKRSKRTAKKEGD